jgi:hypothetical protein
MPKTNTSLLKLFSISLLLAVLAQPVNSIAGVPPTLVPISGLSPYPVDGDENDPNDVIECNGAPQTGRLYRNSEVEPHLEVNPANPLNMIATWHQDRWSDGGAQGIGVAYTKDGGLTWTQTLVPLTLCTGGEGKFKGGKERGSDPWLAWSSDGSVVYLMALLFTNPAISSQAVVRSFDGGETWEEITSLREDPGKSSNVPFNDKNTMIADPDDPDSAYAIWTVFKWGMGTTRFTRTEDGGDSWTRAKEIYRARGDTTPSSFYPYGQGNQIVVLPDGTLLNVFAKLTDDYVNREYGTIRSFDGGKKWEKRAVPIAGMYWDTSAIDWEMYVDSGYENLIWVRDGGFMPDVAVNRNNGRVYMVIQSGGSWQSGSPDDLDAWTRPVITMTTDGGETWTAPIQVPGTYPGGSSNMKFLPEVAVRDDGTVAVLYYDFHTDVFGDSTLDTDIHVAFFDQDLNVQGIQTITPAFDLRQAPYAYGYFPGDYVGFTTDGTDFLAAFTMTHNLGLPVDIPDETLEVDTANRQDVYFARITWP